MTTDDLEKMFEWVDFNEDERIVYNEFQCLMRGRANEDRQEMIEDNYPGGRGFFGGRRDFDLDSLEESFEREFEQ